MLLAAPIIAMAVKAAQIYNRAPENVKKQARVQWNQTPFAKIGSAISNSFFGKNGLFTNPEGAWDKFKNGENSAIARENLQYQKDNFDYQKALQQQIFEREDNAYSRTVSDMRMAGLNPASMNGTNGAGEVINTQSQNNSFNDTGNLQALGTVFNAIQSAIATNSNASLQSSQANLINAQAEAQNIENKTKEDIIGETLKQLQNQNKLFKYEQDQKQYEQLQRKLNAEFNRQYGFSENMPELMKLAYIMSNRDGKRIMNWDYDSEYNPTFYGSKYNNPNLKNYVDKVDVSNEILESQLLQFLMSFAGGAGSTLFKSFFK